ncbi:TSUP family transporter [uncultured Ralstonia sp.]|uniref:TSUP family transporter n=1 Tax=uncultured Ralstonia sp. TaxID=114715 RepID=UPI0025CB81F0|nr:TSUP family transporter [uncultured Ralstonia sp.]
MQVRQAWWRDLSVPALVAGFITVLVGFASSAVIVFQAAQAVGASQAQIASWMWALGLGMGVTCIGLSLRYRVPVVTAWSTPGAAMLVNLLIPFAAYLLAEEIHASGILAAVAAGIAMSYVELTGRVSGSMRVQRAGVWNMLQFSFNGIMFVLLGEQLPGIVERATTTMNESGHQSAWWLLVYVVVINLALVVLRLLWVWLSLRWNLLRARRRGLERGEAPNWRIVVATSVAGVRGAITLAGVLTLPLFLPDGSAFPARDLVIFLAASVILFSLLGAWALTHIPAEPLRRALPFVLVALLVYTVAKKNLGAEHAPSLSGGRERAVALLAGAVIGFYDGVFGPGTGSFLMIVFVRVFGYDFLHASASTKIVNLATNVAALLLLASKGHVWWQLGLVMAVANVAGNQVGSHLALRHGSRFVRKVFIVVVLALILKTAYDAFVR